MQTVIFNNAFGIGNIKKEDKPMATKTLLNITNHPSKGWSNEQREGWDRIIDIPFPSVSPHLNANDREYMGIVMGLLEEIVKVIRQHMEDELYICLQGEFSICYKVFESCRKADYPVAFAIPTTERVVEEIVLPDGTTKKNVTFRFVRWRLMQKESNKGGTDED